MVSVSCHLTPPQVKFWSQHISFILVGIIIVTSIRGLLITLTKVQPVILQIHTHNLSCFNIKFFIFLFSLH